MRITRPPGADIGRDRPNRIPEVLTRTFGDWENPSTNCSSPCPRGRRAMLRRPPYGCGTGLAAMTSLYRCWIEKKPAN